MKKIFTLIFTLIFTVVFASNITTISGQTFKEKMKAKLESIDAKIDGKGKEVNFADSTFVSLSEVASKWEDGSYPIRYSERNYKWLAQSGSIDLKFIKDADGKVTNIIYGGKEMKTVTPTGSTFVIYYGFGPYLYIKGKTIINFDTRSGNSDTFLEACIGEKIDFETVKSEIIAYKKYANNSIDADQAETARLQKIENERLAAIRLKEYGLADKDVVKIEVVDLTIPNKFSHHKSFTYELEATLKDGRKIRTGGSKGYSSDYTITYKEGKINYAGLGVGVIKDDQIVMEVSLKSKPSIKTVKKIAINYDAAITWNWNAHHGGYKKSGSSAENLKLEIKQVNHTITGEKLLMLRLSNLSTGSVIDEVKIGIDETIYLYCKGGNGDVEEGKGYNGGYGGDILVVKDPNVESYNLDYSNSGGNGGSGVYSIGRDGESGTFKELTKSVKFFN